MELLIEFGKKTLLELGAFRLSVAQACIFLLGLILLFFLQSLIFRIWKKNEALKQLSPKLHRFLRRLTSYLLWLIGLIILLRLVKVDTQVFFSFALLKSEKFTLTVMTLFVLLVIFLFIRIMILFVEYLISRKIVKNELDEGKGHSMMQIARYLIWIFGILLAIGAIGLKLTFIIASVSALLIGVGFGLQNIFNDFFSGIILLFDRSIKVRDVVQVGDIVGEVEEIGIRTTKIIDRNNIMLIIPNSKFTEDTIINWSHHDQKSRFSVSVGVAYGSDVQKVETLLLECANETPDVEKKPISFVRFENFGSSSLDFSLFFWTYKTFRVENTKSRLRFLIDQKFRASNIVIPFPQHDLHIKSDFRNKT
ncbi:MAG TPA: mechanosensitive ion channel [Prolixibacteraceae bacterium]|nr:mechanosensitive ion channel [Prolixibacteraceae bacterium]